MKREILAKPAIGKGGCYHYVYRITNLINGMWYIGKHSTANLEDGYLCSSRSVTEAIRTFGVNNFKREILSFHRTEGGALKKERILVTPKEVNDPKCYNRMPGGAGYPGQTRKVPVHDKKGNQFLVDTSDERYIKGELLALSKGRAQKLVKCPHCGVEGGKSPMKQWHFDNCPQNPALSKKEVRKLIGARAEVGKRGLGRKHSTIICPHCAVTVSIGAAKVWHFDNCLLNPSLTKERKQELKLSRSVYNIYGDMPKQTCPYCGKLGGGDNFLRYHFDNCKFRHPNKCLSCKWEEHSECKGRKGCKKYWEPKSFISNFSNKRITCPHCKKITTPSNAKTYHMDNCKFRYRGECLSCKWEDNCDQHQRRGLGGRKDCWEAKPFKRNHLHAKQKPCPHCGKDTSPVNARYHFNNCRRV